MGGVEGAWFPEDYARCVLRDLAIADSRADELTKVKRKLGERNQQIGKLERSGELWEQQEKAMMLNIDAQQKRIDNLEDDLDSVWRSPWLWFGVGVVAGGASIIAVGASL